MSALGLTGVTAYFGLLDVGRPVAGETVVVPAQPARRARSLGRLPRSKAAPSSASRAGRRNAAGGPMRPASMRRSTTSRRTFGRD